MPSALFNSHTTSEGLGETPFHNLTPHPNRDGLHASSPSHLNGKHAEKNRL